ncbi:hypothetical protein PROFUN_07435 [Planoprotostelium fungivorum]|uniref:Uncharacterized protein n=1 Tax=Planoprotostelium fungivorum TaxID=1890364 RepID=A0A2P6NLE3_9EUKA|nr:hypothetical protein PROFUN_07435 [Planoprotostelium fungivorum]
MPRDCTRADLTGATDLKSRANRLRFHRRAQGKASTSITNTSTTGR